MHTVSRVFTRLSLAALCVGFIAALFATSAGAVSVNLRVEGGSATRANTTLNTGPRSIATADGSCVADGGNAPVTNATALTTAADWADSAGTGALFGYGGAFMCGLGGEIGGTSYWLMKINNKTQDPPGTYLDGSTQLKDGDAVLWYFTDDYLKPTLDLIAPKTVGVGQALTGRVDSWDGSSDAVTPAAGANVSGGGATATTGADGLFTIAFNTPGDYLLGVDKSGAIRGSSAISVKAAPQLLPSIQPLPSIPLVRTNRFAACTAKHRKASVAHRRCVRGVRAKQRKECRKPDAQAILHCKKVLARNEGR